MHHNRREVVHNYVRDMKHKHKHKSPHSNYNHGHYYSFRNGYDDKYEDKQSYDLKYNIKKKEADKERNKFITCGLSGLMNIGNTCYFNSTIQLLANCPYVYSFLSDSSIIDKLIKKKITDYIVEYETENKDKKTGQSFKLNKDILKKDIEETLTYQLYKVIKMMWDENTVIRPITLKDTIGKHPTLEGNGQQDAQEALQFILDHIHSETCETVEDTEFKTDIIDKVSSNIEQIKRYSKIIEDSKILKEKQDASDNLMNMYRIDPDTYLMMMAIVQWKPFLQKEGVSDFTHLIWGLICTKRTCCSCSFMSPKFEMFNTIQLSIPKSSYAKSIDLEQCFKHSFVKQTIEYKCSRCEHKMAEEESFIYVYPSILFIQLKRFEQSYDRKRQQFLSNKILTEIDFPIYNLEFTEKSIATDNIKTKLSYELKGVVKHIGSINSGHYVSYCENPVSREWFEFNDNDVLRIPKKVLRQELVTSNAYLLMYKKKDPILDNESDSSSENDLFDDLDNGSNEDSNSDLNDNKDQCIDPNDNSPHQKPIENIYV